MNSPPIQYLRWAKTQKPARFELTVSGVTEVTREEARFTANDLDHTLRGAYGPPELNEIIAARYGAQPENVLPVTGTSTANFLALASAVPPGSRVAIEKPTYEPLIRTAETLGLEVTCFTRDADAGYRPNLAEIEASLSAGARAIVLSDLHNPSGVRCPDNDLRRIADACAAVGASLIVDEVYREMATLNRGLPIGTAASLGSHVATTNSLTKTFGFGPLRAGWIIASPETIGRAGAAFDTLAVNLPGPSASLALAVFRRIEAFEERTRRIWRESLDTFSTWAQSERRLVFPPNDGVTFAYCQLPDGVLAEPFCEFLVEKFDTRVVSGVFFGDPDFIRIGFALPPDVLKEGLQRLSAALDAFPG
jgi:hypothetical protein